MHINHPIKSSDLGRFGKMDTNGLIKSIGMESFQKPYIKTVEDIFSVVYKNNTEGCRPSYPHTLLQCTWIVDMVYATNIS